MSGVCKGTALGPLPLSIFISYTDSGIIKCTLSTKEGMPDREIWKNFRSGIKT